MIEKEGENKLGAWHRLLKMGVYMNKRFDGIDSDEKSSFTSILYRYSGKMEENILFWGYAISFLNAAIVYFSGGTTMVFSNLNYIPIAMVSSNCKKCSRIIHAVVTAFLIGPFMPLDTKLGISQTTLNWTTRLGIYIIIACAIGIFSDLNKRHGEDLARILSTDWLTSFKNINNIKNEASNTKAGTGFIAISLKGYEEVFSFFGNTFSNELVLVYAQKLEALVGKFPEVEFYRYHGLEFIIRVNDASKMLMDQILRQLNMLQGSTIELNGVPIYIENRIGISVIDKDEELDKGLRFSLMALRNAVKNNYRLYEYNFRDEEQYADLISTASHFSIALSQGQIKVAFQKIIHRPGERCGYELLARWQNGSENIPPCKFIPIIEKTDLINELTRFVIMEGIEFILNKNQDVEFVSINFSANSINFQNITFLDEMVRANGIDPKLIVIEVTEEIFIHSEDVIKVIESASQMGYQIAVDDFGSGYSSYKYIDILPIDIIKIDREIIGRMNSKEKTKSIVRSIVNLSKDNNMKTVAEGIETQEIADECMAMGLDFMQGYLYHRPELIKGAEPRY